MSLPSKEFGRARRKLVGDRVHDRRLALGLGLKELGERCRKVGMEVSVQRLSQIENGGDVSVAQLVVFAAALETTTTYLLALTTDPEAWVPEGNLEVAASRVSPKGRMPKVVSKVIQHPLVAGL